MPVPVRIFAFAATAVSGIAAGYGLVDRPPPQISITEAKPAALRPSEPVIPALIAEQVPDPVADIEETTRWTLLQENGAFDDLTNVYLSVPSDAPLSCGARRRASLMLRCLEDRTSIYVAHDCATPPIHSGDWDVDLRLDQNPVETRQMQVDSRGEALGHWEYQDARILIERLTTADRLHMRFTDDEGVATALQFPVAGLSDHLETLRTACHWSDVPPWEVGPHPAKKSAELPAEVRQIINVSGPDRAPESARQTAGSAPSGEYQLLGERLLELGARDKSPIR